MAFMLVLFWISLVSSEIDVLAASQSLLLLESAPSRHASPLLSGYDAKYWITADCFKAVSAQYGIVSIKEVFHPKRYMHEKAIEQRWAICNAINGTPFIAQCIDSIDFLETGYSYLVTKETFGALSDYYPFSNEGGHLSQVFSSHIMAELAVAILSAHIANIVHMNIRPKSVSFVKSEESKTTESALGDFGQLPLMELRRGVIITHTNHYLSTDNLKKYLHPLTISEGYQGELVDWWAFSTILLEIVCGMRFLDIVPRDYSIPNSNFFQSPLCSKVPQEDKHEMNAFFNHVFSESASINTLDENPERFFCMLLNLSYFQGLESVFSRVTIQCQ